MAQYLEKVCKQLKASQTYILTQVLRVDNVHTDALAGLGSVLDHQFKHSISMEYLDKPSIEAKPTIEVSQVSITPNWQSSIIHYLVNDMLPLNRKDWSIGSSKSRQHATICGTTFSSKDPTLDHISVA
ncbi:hypothetical protein ACFX2G_014831 [Malus domestica]